MKLKYLERINGEHHFHREGPTVHVVAQEEILGRFRRPAHLKHFCHVVELSVQISHDCNRIIQFEQIWFLFYLLPN